MVNATEPDQQLPGVAQPDAGGGLVGLAILRRSSTSCAAI